MDRDVKISGQTNKKKFDKRPRIFFIPFDGEKNDILIFF
jgi:hypothetical protein